MTPGELDSRILIYCLKKRESELNEEEPVPVLLKTIWAKVEPRTGSLLIGRPAETMLSKTTHAITVRAAALKGVTPDCYIIWKDLIGQEHRFDIDYILPAVRRQPFASIYCQEVI